MNWTFTWPIGATPESAASLWGWFGIGLGVLTIVTLGGFFLLDLIPYLLHQKGRPAVFGSMFVLVGVTAGINLLLNGVEMLDMQLAPAGPRPADILALAGCVTPLLTFTWQRIRNLRGMPAHYWAGARIVSVTMAASAFSAAFITRVIDITRFAHVNYAWSRSGASIGFLCGVLYFLMALIWLRYQWRVRRMRNPVGWNAIGASLGFVFFQFAFARFSVALAVAGGYYRYPSDSRALHIGIDIASVATALGFLVVAAWLLQGAGQTAEQTASD